nr:phage tail tape measure protein [Dehalococcoidales bacterium]
LDLMAAKEMDAKTAAELLGKVAQGEFGTLSRYGIILKDDATEADALAAIQEKVAGSAEKMASPIDILKASFGDLVESVGTSLLPVLKGLVDAILPIINNIQQWMADNPELSKTIIIIVAAIGGLMAVLGPLLMMLPMIAAGFTMLLGPVGLVILAVTAFAALAALVMMNWEEIKLFFTGLWATVTDIFEDWVENIKLFISSLNPWEWAKSGWEDFREGIKGTLDQIFGHSDIENWVNAVDNYLSETDLAGAGESMFSTFADGIATGLDKAMASISYRMNQVLGVATPGANLPGGLYWSPGHEPGQPGGGLPWPESTGIPVPEYQHGGIVGQTGLAFLHEGEVVNPAGRGAGGRMNIFVELDGRIIARAIGQPFIDEIRLRTGLRSI